MKPSSPTPVALTGSTPTALAPSVRFGHVGITVSDLERSLAFYRAAFGFELGMRVRRTASWIRNIVVGEDAVASADLEFGHMHLESGMHLELIQYRAPAPRPADSELTWRHGHQHLCLTVSAIDHWVARARAAGARLVSDAPVVITEGKNCGSRCCYLRGPDGETIELFEPVKP